MNPKIKEFATLISSSKLCESLRYGHYLVKEDGKFCHIFNINFTLAKRLAANYGQQPFAFHKVDNNGIIKQYYEKQNPSQPIRKANDYVLREESRIEFAIIDFETEPYSTLLSLNEQFADMSDEALTRARESVGRAAIRIRKDVYKGICCQPEALKPLEYYRYECEETFYFSWLLEEEDTRLPVKIMVDEGYAYRMYKHPLWIYLKNGYDKDAELVPLVVCDDPYIPYNIPLQIFRKDFYDVYYFVKENQEKLRLIANKKYDIDNFIEDWYEDLSINESLSLQLNEMANIKPKYSGLPYELWLDGGKSFEKSGHYMRIKFQYPTTKNYSKGNSVTITLPDMEIKPKNKKVPNEVIRQIIGFIKVNEENIMKVLKDGLNPKKVLIPFIIKVDSKGNPIQDDKEPEFYKVSNGECGYTIVKNKEDKFNYIDANGNILSKKWFDVAQPFNERNGKMLAFVKIGVIEYWLSTNGGLKAIEY